MADKYTDDQIKALGAKGHAFRNPDGHYSYPIDDAEDLDNAIRAVGRGGASHDAIRAYIIGRAKAMGLSSKIPDNWTSGGQSTSQQRGPDWQQRRQRWANSLIGQSARRSMKLERGNIEVRARDDGTGGTKFEFHGYAATFGDPFEMFDKWGEPYDEICEPGGFSESLSRRDLDTPFLIGHNEAGLPLARTWQTLKMGQDSRGLETLATMNGRRSDVRDLAIAVEDGNIDEMSIGFVTRGQRWSDDYSVRYMTDLDLHRGDVSVVALAANPATKGASMTALPTEILSLAADLGPAHEDLAVAAPAAEELMLDGTKKRLPMIDAALDQAQAIFEKADLSKVDPKVAQAIELVGSAGVHVDHILKHEGLPDPDKGQSSQWAAGDPAAEQLSNAADASLGNAPDYNVWPRQCPNPACPVGMVDDPNAQFCARCGKPLKAIAASDVTVSLDDQGIPSEEMPNALMSLALRRRELELLALAG